MNGLVLLSAGPVNTYDLVSLPASTGTFHSQPPKVGLSRAQSYSEGLSPRGLFRGRAEVA